MQRIFVYGAQRHAVLSHLESCGLAAEQHRVQTVNSPHHIMGVRGGIFFSVAGHREAVPLEILREVQICGMVTIEIDDRFAREKAAAVHKDEPVREPRPTTDHPGGHL